MHSMAKLLILEQRRQKQLLNLMLIYKNRHLNVRRVHARNPRAANVSSFTRERYHYNKYKNSPYYKGSVLWDGLPIGVRQSICLNDFKKALCQVYCQYDNKLL